MAKTATLFFLIFTIIFHTYAQKNIPGAHFALAAQKTTEKIVLDGNLNEKIWQTSTKATNFRQNYPFDTSYANNQTEAIITYDQNFMYVALICYDANMAKKFVVQSLKRDFDGSNNDFTTLYLSPFSDGLNGFSFAITPLGVLKEGLIYDGVSIAYDWDNKWYGNTQHYEDKWIAEVAIPFKTLRYKENATSWKINIGRADYKNNEISSWVPVPKNFAISNLAFTGNLNFDAPLQKAGGNISIIPYVTGGYSKRNIDPIYERSTKNIGGDAKIALSSSLNLDLTVNPDFSQVDVDQQVINLDRFQIYFPEKRQFFLENADIFDGFGTGDINPFFSRRIGIQIDHSTGLIIPNPILYGARLTGKLDNNWRIGVLNVQTRKDTSQGAIAQNYTATAIQRKVFARSNISAIFINRQSTSDSLKDFNLRIKDFNRVIGVDYNMASKEGTWRGKFFYHQAFFVKNDPNQQSFGAWLIYDTPKWFVNVRQEYVGANYSSDLGYIRRQNYWKITPDVYRQFFPKQNILGVNRFRIGTYHEVTGLPVTNELTDRYHEAFFGVDFNNRSIFVTWAYNEYTKLLFPFDPTNTNGLQLPTYSSYNTYGVGARFYSPPKKVFTYKVEEVSYRQYYGGHMFTIKDLQIGYRIKPFVILSLNTRYNKIILPEPYKSADLFLIGPRFDVTVTKKLFFTLFTQYNKQINNINLNARVQWRFKPVSDFFIVYTDNYFPENLNNKTRAIVAKLTYWINL